MDSDLQQCYNNPVFHQLLEDFFLNNKKNIWYEICLWAGFVSYCIILIALLFFKSSSVQRVNLTPFRFISYYLTHINVMTLINGLGNIILFIPFTIYLCLFFSKKNIWIHLLWACLFSIGAECLQYILKIGVTDIDDVILNTLGGLLGIVAFWLLRKLCKENTRKVITVAFLIIGILFLSIYTCLYYGVFGFRIRIL